MLNPVTWLRHPCSKVASIILSYITQKSDGRGMGVLVVIFALGMKLRCGDKMEKPPSLQACPLADHDPLVLLR